jgi:hypothetical protein
MNSFLRSFVVLSFGISAGTLVGCAHSYYYTPEVAGDGAMASKGGVVYSLPPTSPRYGMKVAYLGIADESVTAHFHKKEKMLRVRMYFLKKSTDSEQNPGFIDPKEETLVLDSGSLVIHPAAVFAHSKSRPRVELVNRQKQTVDFFFPLPHFIGQSITTAKTQRAKQLALTVRIRVHRAEPKCFLRTVYTRFTRVRCSPPIRIG